MLEASPSVIRRQLDPSTVDLMWRIYSKMPRRRSRFHSADAAVTRANARQSHILPPRAAFTTTVDYFEALQPLFMAQAYFQSYYKPASYMQAVHKALKSLLPPQLF